MAHIHFTGVGGVGMAGLAHIAADLGHTITGTDATDSKMLQSLCQCGHAVTVGHRDSIPEGTDLLVYSSAIQPTNPERINARQRNIPELRRGAFLAKLAQEHFKTVIAVSGSHGKTTTTAMAAHIARAAGLNPGYMVGASVNTWERAATAGAGKILITEVDESDGTQALMYPTLAVVLNIDDDHAWSLGGVDKLEECFVTFASHAPHAVTWASSTTQRLLASHRDCMFLSPKDIPTTLELPVPGRHNRGNAAIALHIARFLGIDDDVALEALKSFPGVDRRLAMRAQSPDGGKILIEDYAHHPTELAATVNTLQEAYPRHKLLVVFQPHRFERVLRYTDDFARILSTVSRAWVVAPFAAWLDDSQKANPLRIVEKIAAGKCGGYLPNEPETIASHVLQEAVPPCVIAVIGAGDVSKAIPILSARL